MMSDAWEEIQALKSKRNSLRERLEKRKKERKDILSNNQVLQQHNKSSASCESSCNTSRSVRCDPAAERSVLEALCHASLTVPVASYDLLAKIPCQALSHEMVCNLLQKFDAQRLITVKECPKGGLEVAFVEHTKLTAMVAELGDSFMAKKRAQGQSQGQGSGQGQGQGQRPEEDSDIMSLISMPSAREKQNKRVGEEILELLSRPTAQERSLSERFRSQGGTQVMEFCPAGTRAECRDALCRKLHFRKIIQSHTDESLGDCSFLNTCFHMDTCKYVHYEVDRAGDDAGSSARAGEPPLLLHPHEQQLQQQQLQLVRLQQEEQPHQLQDQLQSAEQPAELAKEEDVACSSSSSSSSSRLYPPQWVQCDLRYLDMTVLGKFAVIMADPPWDIHMELPYGTMSDDEMRRLGVPQLQDEGLIFLWVTGRAMELGRECLQLWGYERVDEIIWVKTNQLQRIIRTGRTGHWLNHGKEHCLVGMKGEPQRALNRGLDCDVIVAEVRATSHKPDEIYGMIERLSPGTRKIELFGRPHNVQPNWITLGNQVDGVRLVDPDLIKAFQRRYPDGNCMLAKPDPQQAD